jgi:hypothetical protein
MDSLSGKKFEVGEVGAPKKKFAPIRTKLTPDKRKANVEPAATPQELTALWDRDFSVYRACIVKVLGRKGSMISFALVNTKTGVEVTNHGSAFTVDLDDGAMVWSDLPSTAQLVKPGAKKAFGFLMLSDKYFQTTGFFDEELPDWWEGPSDPPKIPRNLSL